ncbi:MAG: GWxTD domain-containing protein [Candidatus Aminicenantes bacterium]|nr:GWxTD domain-containing protein [Candidatus Aminicenantes bacterium]
MSGRRSLAWALATLLGAAGVGAGSSPALSSRQEAWLADEVSLLITPAEREAFLKLGTDADRELFIAEFWRQRDPTPGTPANEFRDEHARRIVFADERFGGEDAPVGRRTDRGRTLIALGPPLDVQTFATPDICPVEIWYYLREIRAGGPALVRFLFFQEYGAAEYKLYHPLKDGPKRLVPFPERWEDEGSGGPPFPAEWTKTDAKAYRILTAVVTGELAEASFSSFPGSTVADDPARSAALIAELMASPRRRVNDDYAASFTGRESGSAPVAYAKHGIGSRSAAAALRDASGRLLLNYLIAPDRLALEVFQDRYFAGLRVKVKATDAAGRVAFQSETFRPVTAAPGELRALAQSPFELYGSFPIEPGAYRLDLVLENTVSKEFASSSLEVRAPEEAGLRMSPLVLSRNAVRTEGAGGAVRPFQAGPFQLYPSVDGLFMTNDVLLVFAQLEGLEAEEARGASVVYSVLSGETALRTSRRDLADGADRQDLLEEIALSGLEPGAYAVKAALLDGEGREILSRTAEFAVTAKFVPGRWVIF